MLAPEGRLLLALRLREPGAGPLDRRARGASDERITAVSDALRRAGFRALASEAHAPAGERHAFLLASR